MRKQSNNNWWHAHAPFWQTHAALCTMRGDFYRMLARNWDSVVAVNPMTNGVAHYCRMQSRNCDAQAHFCRMLASF